MTIFYFDFHFGWKCSFECSFRTFNGYYITCSYAYFNACRDSYRKSSDS